MRSGVEHAIRGEDAVEARAADPVVLIIALIGGIHILDARAGQQHEVATGLRLVAAMMADPFELRQIELLLHFTRDQITAHEGARRFRTGDVHRPHQILHQHHAHRAAVVVVYPRCLPHEFAIRERNGRELAIPRVIHRLVVQHDGGRFFGEGEQRLCRLRDGRGLPFLRAGFQIEANQAVTVVIHHVLTTRREREHADLRPGMFPQHLSALRLDGDDVLRRCVIEHNTVTSVVAEMTAFLRLLGDLLHVRRRGIAHHEKNALRGDDLLGGSGAFINAKLLASGGVELHQRAIDVERCIHSIPNGDQLARHLRRTTFPRPETCEPLREWLLPEHDTVVSIACRELPVSRELHGGARTFVHDVKYAAVRRHHRIQARHALMRRGPKWRARPLKTTGQSAALVLAHRIVRRVVLIMRPLRCLGRVWFRFHRPCAAHFSQNRTTGSQHPHRLVGSDFGADIEKEQVHQILSMRQRIARPKFRREPRGRAMSGKSRARLLHLSGIRIHRMHDQRGPRRCNLGRELSIARADMDDQAACGVAHFEQTLRVVRLSERERGEREDGGGGEGEGEQVFHGWFQKQVGSRMGGRRMN